MRTILLAGFLEKGHSLLPALTFFTKAFRSEDAFLAHLPQQTLNVRTLSALTALPEKGHFSLTGGACLAAKEKREIDKIPAIVRNFCREIYMQVFLP